MLFSPQRCGSRCASGSGSTRIGSGWVKFPAINYSQVFGHQNPGSGTGSGSALGSGSGSTIRKNAGSGSVSGSALNQGGSTSLSLPTHVLYVSFASKLTSSHLAFLQSLSSDDFWCTYLCKAHSTHLMWQHIPINKTFVTTDVVFKILN